MGKQERGVFFDCWNTLITFEAEDPMWIIMPLKKHAIHSTQYHWDEIFEFADNFLKTYYRSHSLYEISDQAFLRTVMMNYEVLANIYKSRKDHKLDEWRGFCIWIQKLPYSELITNED